MSFFKKLKNQMGEQFYRFLVDNYPRKAIDRLWMRYYGHKMNWDNPQDINEKIQWLICYGDTSKWTDLADKYKVREYVKSKGLGELLPELYGVWDNADKIDYEALPNKFVLKCNHDSGSCHFIDKSKGFNKEQINIELNKSLKKKYGYSDCEPHYNKIKPLIVAEQYLESTDEDFSFSLVDYKVWCFDGKPYSVWACYNRDHDGTDVNLYDLDWNVHPECSVFTPYFRDGKNKVKRPEKLEEMLLAASKLSEGFPEVRVDFYIVEDKLYFGEMTFTCARGRMSFYTKEYLKELGDQVKLPL